MAKLIVNKNHAQGEVLARSDAFYSGGGMGLLMKALGYGVLMAVGVFTGVPLTKAQEVNAQASRAFNPVYPYDALIAGRGGWAEISYTVDYSGRAILPTVDGASEKAFALAFQADIDSIEFIPPRRNGQPVMSLSKQRFEFPAQPALDAIAREILNELRKPKPNLCPVEELDSKPEALRKPPSAYPWVLRGDGESGKAEVEFVIDRNGRVLFPRIVSATHEDFGWSAATAVTRWRYKPPTKGGVKVDTRIKETIVYDINKTSGMW